MRETEGEKIERKKMKQKVVRPVQQTTVYDAFKAPPPGGTHESVPVFHTLQQIRDAFLKAPASLCSHFSCGCRLGKYILNYRR